MPRVAVSRCVGPYEYVKTVGRGSFGVAVLVKDKDNKQYIVKQIDISDMTERDKKEVTSEVQMLAKLASHPFVVRYRLAFVEDPFLCIVMDYCQGGELHKVIAERRNKKKKFTEKEAKRMLTQLLLAVKHLHDHHVIHRDMKTPNVFMDEDGRLRLGDFGLAKALGNSANFAKTFCGTPGFMPPELIKNEPYSYAADIWALGCVMYEILSFSLPFSGTTFPEIMKRIVTDKPIDLSKSYSEDLRNICASMLYKNPKKRPSAAQLIQSNYIQEELKLMSQERKNSGK